MTKEKNKNTWDFEASENKEKQTLKDNKLPPYTEHITQPKKLKKKKG